MIDRRVIILGENGQDGVGRPLSAFRQDANYVLLGDPGSGKTECFRQEAAAHDEACLTARQFLLRPTDRLPDTLYIDGLDEQRSGPHDQSVIDRIVKKLLERKPRRVRISCRSQDWLGETDTAALREYFDHHGGLRVLLLQSTTDSEKLAILEAHGLTLPDAHVFLQQAAERGLEGLTQNPHKMLMLHRVVAAGQWPGSIKDLFEQATRIQLRERNPADAINPQRQYSDEELRLTAGAICAARLIADVEGVSLAANSEMPFCPGYRSLRHLNPDLVAACLRRPLFTQSAVGCVDYDHRTSAEYLGAAWIGDAVRHGLPFGRVMALMGVDGHPATELRGLHAWLPHFLPNEAGRIIRADPLGVLEYGDPASLTGSQKRLLLEALGALAAENPWFLAVNRIPRGLSALADPENAETLCEILVDPDAPRDLRTVALIAIGSAPHLEGAFSALLQVFGDSSRHWNDRWHALQALVNAGAHGREAILAAYPALVGDPQDVLRLKSAILTRYYGEGLTSTDVVDLLRHLMETSLESRIGLLWDLADVIPTSDIPAILDALSSHAPREYEDIRTRTCWDVASFFNRLIGRIPHSVLTPERVLRWLSLQRSFHRLGADDRDRTFISLVRANPALVRATFDQSVDDYVPDSQSGRAFRQFMEAVAPLATREDLCTWSIDRLAIETNAARRELLLDFALVHSRGGSERDGANFERLYDIADRADDLRPRLERAMVCDLEWWYAERVRPLWKRRKNRAREDQTLRQQFSAARKAIQDGTALRYLGFAAQVYFGLFADLDRNATPEERLVACLGEENATVALEGFQALLQRQRPPSLEELQRAVSENQFYPWWFGLVAGVDAVIAAQRTSGDLDPSVISAVLHLDLHHLLSRRRNADREDGPNLQDTLSEEHPALAAAVYLQSIEAGLDAGAENPTGLCTFLKSDVFRQARTDSILGLLDRYPSMSPNAREQLLRAALAIPDLADDLGGRVQTALENPTASPSETHVWLAAGFVVKHPGIDARLADAFRADRDVIWALRDFFGYDRRSTPLTSLNPSQLQVVINHAGAAWPPVDHPMSWSGNRNPWDATEFVRALINQLSSMPSTDASAALEALAGMPQLNGYLSHIQHARAQQLIVRRTAEYDRPDWARTLATLANSTPANAADLHALVVDQLRDLAKEIDGSNHNLFQNFWNEDGAGRKGSPKRETSCRDALVPLLSRRLGHHGLVVEPESRMSADKRVDIAIMRPGLKSIVEVKLAHSRDLWDAANEQLDRFYTRDPDTKGYGILLVLWFGAESPKKVTRSQSGAVPATPAQLEQMLLEALPVSALNRLDVIAIDVSGDRPLLRSQL